MQIAISPFIDLLNSILCAVCCWQLYRSFRRDTRQVVLRFWASAYFALIFSYLFFSIPRIV
ncbi:MAG: hypothetical protein V1916_02005, partial [Patescibacteria group bacterium]